MKTEVEAPIVIPDVYDLSSPAAKMIDALQREDFKLPQVTCEVRHFFTKGMYARECHIPENTRITSQIHKTEHQYILSQGVCSVFIDGVGIELISAPFHGITKAGTRRVIIAHSDLIWTTFHPTDKTDVDSVKADIIMEHDARLMLPESEGGA